MPDGSSIIFKIRNAAMALTLATAFVVVPGTASADYVQDGIINAGEYGNSFFTDWFNDHESGAGKGSQFPEGGLGQTTTVWWDVTVSGDFIMGFDAPFTVKNMVWGDFLLTAAPSAGFDEAILYYQHWCSPDDGNPAALDGSNCGHHDQGFDSFKAGIDSADFKTMVDSEGVKLGSGSDTMAGDQFKLIDTETGAASAHDASYVTSLTYILANPGLFPNCDSSSCDAVGTSMSFEMLWADETIGEAYKDWLSENDNDLVFHMSPERNGPAVIPVPAAFWLFGTALIGFVSFSRRTKISA